MQGMYSKRVCEAALALDGTGVPSLRGSHRLPIPEHAHEATLRAPNTQTLLQEFDRRQ